MNPTTAASDGSSFNITRTTSTIHTTDTSVLRTSLSYHLTHWREQSPNKVIQFITESVVALALTILATPRAAAAQLRKLLDAIEQLRLMVLSGTLPVAAVIVDVITDILVATADSGALGPRMNLALIRHNIT